MTRVLSFRQVRNLGLGVMTTLIITISTFSFFILKEINNNLNFMQDKQLHSMDAALHAQREFAEIVTRFKKYLNGQLDEYQHIDRLIGNCKQHLLEVNIDLTANEEESFKKFNKILKHLKYIFKRYNKAILYDPASSNAEQLSTLVGSKISGANISLNIILDNIQHKIQTSNKEIAQKTIKHREVFVVFLCLAVIVGIVIMVIFNNALARPINKLIEGTKKIGAGNLDWQIADNKNDELGQLVTSFNTMADRLVEERTGQLEEDKKRLEEMVDERTTELTNTNEHLEQEIAERKKAAQILIESEEKLKRSEKKFKSFFDDAAESTLIVGESGDILGVNKVAIKRYGYSNKEFLELKIFELDAPETPTKLDEKIKTTEEEGYSVFERIHILKDGTKIPVEVSCSSIEYKGQKALLATVRDITERKQMEEILKESEEKFRTLIETAYDAIFITDIETEKIIGINNKAEKLLGLPAEKIIGMHYTELYPKEESELYSKRFQVAIQKNEDIVTNALMVNKVPVDISFSVATAGGKKILQGVFRDITERKQAEEEILKLNNELEQKVIKRSKKLKDVQDELVRKERLALLGQLSGSVGHELRNPLATVNNAIYYLKMIQPDPDEKIKEYMDILSSEITNMKKIVSDLLDFSRIKQSEKEKVTVSELFSQVLKKQPPPEEIKLSTELPADLFPVFVDSRQIQQVLTNLVTNACQAMPEGGNLIIKAQNNSQNVRISVSDTGCGISDEDRKKIFEPLYTTKARGIGLGLSVTRNLVELNEGSIELISKVGKGSTFTIHLPIKKA